MARVTISHTVEFEKIPAKAVLMLREACDEIERALLEGADEIEEEVLVHKNYISAVEKLERARRALVSADMSLADSHGLLLDFNKALIDAREETSKQLNLNLPLPTEGRGEV